MNIWHILANISKDIAAVKDLTNRLLAFHSDPVIVAAIAANPVLKADSDAISADVRTLQGSLK